MPSAMTKLLVSLHAVILNQAQGQLCLTPFSALCLPHVIEDDLQTAC